MSTFWEKRLGTPAPEPVRAQSPAKVWWQTEPAETYQQAVPDRFSQLAPQSHGYGHPDTGMTQQQEHQLFQQLSRINADKLTPDQMEFMAEYELKKPKYNQSCPQCGSGNFIPHGTRAGSVMMPTDKCFDCGYSARGPEPALSGRGSAAGRATRQIDTGGGAGPSLYMSFQRVPSSYMPRG
jgi:ribosomal protein S27AE